MELYSTISHCDYSVKSLKIIFEFKTLFCKSAVIYTLRDCFTGDLIKWMIA
jgi:hypothetical protein